MKKYAYVSIQLGLFNGVGTKEIRQAIDGHAAEGYRYAGYIPTLFSQNGRIVEMELVFEKDEEN